MLVKLSSKGQLIIPKAVRRALGLEAGDELRLRLVERRIVLEPVRGGSLIEALYGRYAGAHLLEELEQEHQQEIRDELELRA
jgi:AbrB family looped-hinge helix DNA binding protein